jgi:hypothetical protein
LRHGARITCRISLPVVVREAVRRTRHPIRAPSASSGTETPRPRFHRESFETPPDVPKGDCASSPRARATGLGQFPRLPAGFKAARLTRPSHVFEKSPRFSAVARSQRPGASQRGGVATGTQLVLVPGERPTPAVAGLSNHDSRPRLIGPTSKTSYALFRPPSPFRPPD